MSGLDMNHESTELATAVQEVTRAHDEMGAGPEGVAQVYRAACECKCKAEKLLRKMLATVALVSPEVSEAKDAAEKAAISTAVERLFKEHITNTNK